MRVIFEESDGDYFFEIILSEEDFIKLVKDDCIAGDFAWDNGKEIKDLNVFIRKEIKEINGKRVSYGLRNDTKGKGLANS